MSARRSPKPAKPNPVRATHPTACSLVVTPRTKHSALRRKYFCNVVFIFPKPPPFNNIKLSPRLPAAMKSLHRGRGAIMRIAVAVAVACLSLVAITSGKDAEAAIRRQTNITAQGLAPALRILAKERDVQLVYRTDLVGDHQTSGAAGDLTFDEALTQLLSGTGLTYRYLENNAITIVPIASAARNGASGRRK